MDSKMFEDGWEQVTAGVALICWSRLATWDVQRLVLISAREDKFESDHKEIDNEYGRLLCWIAFGIGGEYLAKGACILTGLTVSKSEPKQILRIPRSDEDLVAWVRRVRAKDPRLCSPEPVFKTFGNLPVNDVPKREGDRDFVWASIHLLASAIRNRDAHRYTKNKRAFHFHLVEELFVPAFNILLASLDEKELASRIVR